jgi:hypothetical protein
MRHAQLAGAIHAIALIALSWRAAARLTAGALDRMAATYLLTWCNLVATGLLLSLASRLDDVLLYLALSLALAAGVEAVLGRGHVVPHRIEIVVGVRDDTRFDRVVRGVLGGTFLLAALASAIICAAYVPNNWDSGAYRLSRPFFYLAAGNLLHTANLDPRLTFYPLNGVLAYVFLAKYQYPAQWMSLPTYVAWVAAAGAVYLAARRLGATRTGGLVAAWLCGLTPNILAQATATTDEVLAVVPILTGLVFGIDFWSTGLKRYAVLAGIGVGLGLGTKLHWVFYWTFLLVAGVAVAIGALRRPAFRSILALRCPMLVVATAIAASLSVPFMVSNYISSGHITHTRFNNLVLNNPFRLSLALEKIRVNTAELFLSPIVDLVPPRDRAQRQAAYAAFNQFFMRCCFSDLVETVKLPYPGGYFFQGPANPEGFLFYEYTWLGFLPHLLLLVGVAYLVAYRALPVLGLVLVLGFFSWHATSAMQTRYQAGQIYYGFAAVLAAAALGPAWDFARTRRGWIARVVMAGFVVVFVTHGLLAYNLLEFGGLRNLQFLWKLERAPDAHPVDPPVVAVLRAAREVYIPYTHWELLYWNLMRFNPAARYTTGGTPRLPSRDTLMLLSIVPRIDAATLPARLPPHSVPGLTYLGRADGEHVFAQGDGVDSRFPERSRYALVRLTWSRSPLTGAIEGPETLECCIGLDRTDEVEVRYTLQIKDGQSSVTLEWSRPGQPALRLSGPRPAPYDTLAIETRRIQDASEIVRTFYRLDQEYYDVGKSETTIITADGGVVATLPARGIGTSPR